MCSLFLSLGHSKPQMEGKIVYGELLANSDGVRGDCRVSPGSYGVKETVIGASHPHLSAEVKTRSETYFFFF